MAIADFDTYLARLRSPPQEIYTSKTTTAAQNNTPRWSSQWTAAPFAGSAPGAAAVPTGATAGALNDYVDGTAKRLAQMSWHCVPTNNGESKATVAILCDRLSHQSGLDGTVTSAQTTNLPTAALTRYTDGIGVMACIEIYTAIGTVATTLTVSYTNSAGAAGRISPAIAIGGSPIRQPRTFLFVPLAAGDVGVRSVESVTLAGSTTSAGNFGVTLIKPIALFPEHGYMASQDQLIGGAGNLPLLVANACLFWVTRTITNTNSMSGYLRFVED